MVPWDRKSCRLGGYCGPAPCARLADKESPPAGGDEPPMAANAASRLGLPGGNFLGWFRGLSSSSGRLRRPLVFRGSTRSLYLLAEKTVVAFPTTKCFAALRHISIAGANRKAKEFPG